VSLPDILILGAGGLAREVAFLLEEINRATPTWNILGFVESDSARVGAQIGKYRVAYAEDTVPADRKIALVMGFGNPAIITKVSQRFVNQPNLSFPNIIHPATVWDKERIALGAGNIICAGNIFTTDIQIGSFNYFNLNCTTGHDTQIGDCCILNPGINLSGGVVMGSRCLIGTGATILQYLTIGDDAIVGAGSVVTKDVSSGVTVVGIPAKPLSRA
jgi:sugar O-acyltransferase (sialic acid O-acetyltransferase NeuD family)